MNLFALRVMHQWRLATAGLTVAAIPALSRAEGLLHESALSLGQVRDATRAWASAGFNANAKVLAEVKREVDAALDQLARLTHCAEPAQLYLSSGSTLQLEGAGVLAIRVMGAIGAHDFAFASGTMQEDIVAAVNNFSEPVGTKAEQSTENPERVRFTSLAPGSTTWVRVKQLNVDEYNYNLLADCASCHVSTADLADYGFDGYVGDVNCDHHVDKHDLVAVLDAWGLCAPPPDVCPADVDNDGAVSITDLLFVIQNWTFFD